jgi:hypothetical protein
LTLARYFWPEASLAICFFPRSFLRSRAGSRRTQPCIRTPCLVPQTHVPSTSKRLRLQDVADLLLCMQRCRTDLLCAAYARRRSLAARIRRTSNLWGQNMQHARIPRKHNRSLGHQRSRDEVQKGPHSLAQNEGRPGPMAHYYNQAHDMAILNIASHEFLASMSDPSLF